MKRSCETCLYSGEATDYSQDLIDCHHTGSNRRCTEPDWWCSLWEPRDRSLVRCETCEWYEGGRCRRHLIKEIVGTTTGLNGAIVTKGFHCAHWRLREERDDD